MASRLMAMDSPPELPVFLRDPSEGQPVQRELFGESGEAALPSTGLFAEIVFDRPLDHAYTYAVPEAIRDQVAIGKPVDGRE